MSAPLTPQQLFCVQLGKNLAGLDFAKAAALFAGYLERIQVPQSMFANPIEWANRVSDAWERQSVPNFNQFAKLMKEVMGAAAPGAARKDAGLYVVPPELESSDLPSGDRANVVVWLKHDAAGDLSSRDMTTRLAIIRQCCERGFQWLVRENDHAARIAHLQGWRREPEETPQPLPETRKPLSESPLWSETQPLVEAVTSPPLYQAPAKSAPPLISDVVEQKTGRKLGALDPAVLEAARASNEHIMRARTLLAEQARLKALEEHPPPKGPVQLVAVPGGVQKRGRLQWD